MLTFIIDLRLTPALRKIEGISGLCALLFAFRALLHAPRSRLLALIVLLLAPCSVLVAPCFSADAQQSKKIFRIGYLSDSSPARESARAEAIRRALRELGYNEGKNIATEYRYAEGKADRAPELAAELVRLNVDIIVVAGGDIQLRAAKNATSTIPIVMVGQGGDPVEAGHVKSLAHQAATLLALLC